MSASKRAVRTFQVPQMNVDAKPDAFLNEIRFYVENERPRFVLDCSNIVSLNVATLHLLLCCLEEAMKCNGDVRLAALTAYAEAALDKTGIHRLFETYETVAMGIQSYQRPSNETFSSPRRRKQHSDENAA